MSRFFLIGTFAWYIKPVFGLIADSVPLLGTRRRHWLLASALTGGLLWLATGVAGGSYLTLLAAVIALNFALVMGSTVTGGLLVEEGQKHGATGRFSSLRLMTDNITNIIVGPISGYLAARGLGLTSGIAAFLMFLLFVAVLVALPEQRHHTASAQVWKDAGTQFCTLFRSKTMWAAAGFIFLLMVSPGFNTPLLFYQTNVLGFKPQFIGMLGLWSAIPGLVAAFVYAAACKHISLKPLFAIGITLTAASTLLYLWYNNATTAIIITAISGFCGTLALIPILDLTARATPSGSGSFGYALILSVYNIAIQLSDYIGSGVFDRYHWTFKNLVWLNAGTTAAVLIFLPFLPAVLMKRRDGQTQTAPTET
jgi:Na+/melibiose symporter-like transporter